MQIILKIILYGKPFTVCYLTSKELFLSDPTCLKLLGLQDLKANAIDLNFMKHKKIICYRTNAYFLQPFIKECLYSVNYKANVLNNIYHKIGSNEQDIICLKMKFLAPDKEIIDYVWNEKMLRLIWTRIEIENAFSWLSTLGGAYSALGDYFEHCAEEAGRISLRQYRLSQMLGDESLMARSKLYAALSYSQKGKLRIARHIVRDIAQFAQESNDKRLLRMCQGVWAKLKYLRALKKIPKLSLTENEGNGKVKNLL